MHATIGNTAAVDLDLVRQGERHELLALAHAQTRKIVAGAVRPLEVDLAETRILAGRTHILFERAHRATEGAIDAMFRNKDAAGKAQRLAQRALPELDSLWIGHRGEAVIQNDLLQFHNPNFTLVG